MSIINCVCSVSVCHKQPITEGLDQANKKLTFALTCVISITSDARGILNMSRLNHYCKHSIDIFYTFKQAKLI